MLGVIHRVGVVVTRWLEMETKPTEVVVMQINVVHRSTKVVLKLMIRPTSMLC